MDLPHAAPAILAAVLHFFSLAVGKHLDYPTANASAHWTNLPSSLPDSITLGDGSAVRSLLLRLDSAHWFTCFAFGFVSDASAPAGAAAFRVGVFITGCDSGGSLTFANNAPVLVWSANRAQPVRENATLQFAAGDLALRDADGGLVWSSGTAGKPVAGIRIAETGNLMLFDESNSSIWESFAHPTDTLVLNQTLQEGMRLTADAAAGNSTAGPLYLTVLSNGLFAFVGSDPSQAYYSYTFNNAKPLNRSMPMSMTFLNGSLQFAAQQGKISLPPVQSIQYLRLEPDGHLRLYDYLLQNWSMVRDVLDVFPDGCAYPTVCGDYGICTSMQCSCPPRYFSQADSRRPNLGCDPIVPLSCENKLQQQMLTLPGIDYFNAADGANARSEDSCKQACMDNCSCKAALFRYQADGTSGDCYLQNDVFSLQMNQPNVVHYNSTVHIKVQLNTTSAPIQDQSGTSNASHTNQARDVMIGIAAGVLALVIIVVGLLYLKRVRKRDSEEDYLNQVPGLPTRYSYEELRAATRDFSTKLGQGGFASVFEGTISGERVAVKNLDRVSHEKDFLVEVEAIGSIHHINLVRLVGFCRERSHHLLVYEFMARGSLDKWIFPDRDNEPLDWFTRRKIMKDIAKGLCYLHEGCRRKVAHLDIKPQNILLDEEFNAKISDFGLSKLIEKGENPVMTRMRGTPGYLAPEWLTSIVTEKADIYSFGILMMEIICGRKNLDVTLPEEELHLISLLQEKLKSNELLDLVDRRSHDMQLHKEDAVEVMKLAMWCLQTDSSRRPMMSTVINVLDGAITAETDIDHNFVVSTNTVPNRKEGSSSFSPSAALLSGPR